MANEHFFKAIEEGDIAGVQEFMPAMASRKGGPRDWEPILYVYFSPSAVKQPEMVEIAKLLLNNGANPNAFYLSPDGCQLTCLYGATGFKNNVNLARVLIEAGANVNDGESLYHSTEHADHACLKLLLENGAAASSTNVLKHMLDRKTRKGFNCCWLPVQTRMTCSITVRRRFTGQFGAGEARKSLNYYWTAEQT